MKEVNIIKALTFIEPGPVALVTTFDGLKQNIMTISWTMPTDWEGGIALTTGPWNYSFQALMKTKECVIAIPPADILEKVIQIGDISGEKTDKFSLFNLTPLPAKTVQAPLIQECMACLECKMTDYIEKYGIFIFKTTRVLINESCLDKKMIHAIGDGTFIIDGEKKDCRSLIADKLPPDL